MQSYDLYLHKRIETPDKIIEFFNEIDALCKKYGFSISHEDGHGAFIIEDYDESNIKWLKGAQLDILENFPL